MHTCTIIPPICTSTLYLTLQGTAMEFSVLQFIKGFKDIGACFFPLWSNNLWKSFSHYAYLTSILLPSVTEEVVNYGILILH